MILARRTKRASSVWELAICSNLLFCSLLHSIGFGFLGIVLSIVVDNREYTIYRLLMQVNTRACPRIAPDAHFIGHFVGYLVRNPRILSVVRQSNRQSDRQR